MSRIIVPTFKMDQSGEATAPASALDAHPPPCNLAGPPVQTPLLRQPQVRFLQLKHLKITLFHSCLHSEVQAPESTKTMPMGGDVADVEKTEL